MEKHLNKCLDSLIVKDMNLMEVLVINDGSKDKSSEIAHEYVRKYPGTFRVIDKENGNYGSCINRGLIEAKGEYIKVLDADDWFNSIGLNIFINKLLVSDADLVLTDYTSVYEYKKKTHHSYPFREGILYTKEIMNELAFKNMQMHTVAYRKAIFTTLNYQQTEGISYTDQEWIFYPMQGVKSIIYFNIDLYQYLIGRAGQTMSPDSMRRYVSHQILIAEKMLDSKHYKFNDKDLCNYLDYRISEICKSVYRIVLLFSRNKGENENLMILDSKIKMNNANVYKNLNQEIIHKYLPFKYISIFRKKGKVNDTILYLYRCLKRFKRHL